MIDLNASELDRLYEGSKDDHYIVVGSEVRQMIGMIRRSNTRIEQLEAALREITIYNDNITKTIRAALSDQTTPLKAIT